MPHRLGRLSTGIPGLDKALRGLVPGDNLVWRVAYVEDSTAFAKPFVAWAKGRGRRVIYFRYAHHEPFITSDEGAEHYPLDPHSGFEPFIGEIHEVLDDVGGDACYVFDCLSDLAVDWNSDRMLGNFFLLVCPYVYDLGALAYFTVLRNYHSFHATTPIRKTAQILLDVYNHKDRLYVLPVQVQQRYSPTMHMLHRVDGADLAPVSDSTTVSGVVTSDTRQGLDGGARLGIWSRTFLEAEEVSSAWRRGQGREEEVWMYFRRLLRMAVSRDERILELAEQYFTLPDLIDVRRRMIGTGLIGGKAVGMLLAHAILRKSDPQWEDFLEPHDSFYVGSDVFYTFLVQNGCWWMRRKQRNPDAFFEGAEAVRRQILNGGFPEYIEKQFADMLDHFGQSPIIVRSSSLLEDAYGNSFAGKAKSVFCANQGPRDARLDEFLAAVRQIYASSLSKESLAYRAQRGLIDCDEQMSLLVQRVSGRIHGGLYFPHVAGVGLSYNPFVWSEEIDPRAGMLRLVFGLATRAVERTDDDHARIVALNAPDRRPEGEISRIRQYAQHQVDVLDLEANRVLSLPVSEVCERAPDLGIDLFAAYDGELADLEIAGRKVFPYVLTFEKLLAETPFIPRMREMLRVLEEAYGNPVDIEFNVNFFDTGTHTIHLSQCRPLGSRGEGVAVDLPETLEDDRIVVRSRGCVIGRSRETAVDRLIYVVPETYGQLPVRDRPTVARLLGRLMHLDGQKEAKSIMLVGPGRWGTTTSSLGVPVSFAEINTVSVLGEIVAMREDLVPDVSLGTHFFNEIVELDVLYFACDPEEEGSRINRGILEGAENRLAELVPGAAKWSEVVRVIDAARLKEIGSMKVNANTPKQALVCYLDGALTRSSGS